MQAKVLFIGAGLLLAAGQAFADDPGTPAGGGAGDAAAPVAGAGSGSAAGTAEATAATPAAGAWLGPQIDRPYAMAKGKIGAYGDFDIAHFSASSGMASISITRELLDIGGAYGITDQLSAGLQYGIPLASQLPAGASDNSTGKGPLTIFGMFQIMHDPKLSVAATADFTIDLCGATDMMGNCNSTKAIHAGLGAKYQVAPKMAVFTGAPFGPGPVGQHLAISLETNGPITFGLPVGFAFQATPQIFTWVSTELFNAYLSNAPMGVDSFRIIGSDITKGGIGIPLQIGGLYGVNNQLDIGLALSFFDLGHAGDYYTIGVLGRWHN